MAAKQHEPLEGSIWDIRSLCWTLRDIGAFLVTGVQAPDAKLPASALKLFPGATRIKALPSQPNHPLPSPDLLELLQQIQHNVVDLDVREMLEHSDAVERIAQALASCDARLKSLKVTRYGNGLGAAFSKDDVDVIITAHPGLGTLWLPVQRSSERECWQPNLPSTLTSLRLQGRTTSTIDVPLLDITSISSFSGLHELHLQDVEIGIPATSPIDVSPLQTLTSHQNLRILKLDRFDAATPECWSSLAALRHLQHLHIRSISISEASSTKEPLQSLRSLQLRESSEQETEPAALSPLLPNLERVAIDNAKHLHPLLLALQGHATLTTIQAGHTQHWPQHHQHHSIFRSFPSLGELHLETSKLDQASMVNFLRDLTSCASLRSIAITDWHHYFREQQLQATAHGTCSSTLQHLQLTGMDATDEPGMFSNAPDYKVLLQLLPGTLLGLQQLELSLLRVPPTAGLFSKAVRRFGVEVVAVGKWDIGPLGALTCGVDVTVQKGRQVTRIVSQTHGLGRRDGFASVARGAVRAARADWASFFTWEGAPL